MRRKALLLLAVGCLVALAGCSGALSGATGDDATLEDVSYPDGVSENGTNVSALAAGHTAALENSSFTLSIESTQNTSMGNQSVRMAAAMTADRDRLHANITSASRDISVYATEEKQFRRVVADGESSYRVTERTPEAMQFVPPSYSGARYVEQFGSMANFTPTEVREVDGTTLVALEANESDVDVSGDVNVTDYDATILVDERGAIHRISVEAETTQNDQSARIAFSMEISDVGETSVEEPNWLDEARNSTES
jgi:hypothetical protein